MFGDEITTLGETTHENRGEIGFENLFFGTFFFSFEGTLGGLFSNFFFGTFSF
jgi:hypothetical protein